MPKKRKRDKNYLEFIPVRNPDFPWELNQNGLVVVTIFRNGFYDKIAQKVFKKPKSSKITLDEFGSFIWQQIDDSSTIFAIGEKVQEQFGKRANPLYERLIKFLEVLKDNRFITIKESSDA